MSANDEQIGGTHYRDMDIQPWDAMRAWMSPEQFCGYLLGNVIKYAARHRSKGGIEDLRKARHYLDKLIEQEEVMQTGSARLDNDPQRESAVCNSVDPPAVSESAAGEMQQAVNHGVSDWPGPDWSQAPEWAMWWAMDLSKDCEWHANQPCIEHELNFKAGWYSDGRSRTAPSFNYPGHWRDSLRERPKG